jgi:hypothetical protein
MDLPTGKAGPTNEPWTMGRLDRGQPGRFEALASDNHRHGSTGNGSSLTEHHPQDLLFEDSRIPKETASLQTFERFASKLDPVGQITSAGDFPQKHLHQTWLNDNWNFCSLADISDANFSIDDQAMSYESDMPTSSVGFGGETTPSFPGQHMGAGARFMAPTFSIPRIPQGPTTKTSYAVHGPGNGMLSSQRNSRPPPSPLHKLFDDGKVKKRSARGKQSFARALHLLEQLKEELELCPRLTMPISRLEESIGEELLRKIRSTQSSFPFDMDSCDSNSSYSAIHSHTSTDLTSVSSNSDLDFLAQDESSVSDASMYQNQVDAFDMDTLMDTETPRAHPTMKPLYQCTFIASDGKLCTFSTKTRCDWVKHQESEKHYPQKRYICLHCVSVVPDENGHLLCVFCFEQLPVSGPSKTHYLQCEKAKKKGKHIFAANRDDHFRNHLRTCHQIPNIGAEESTWIFDVHCGWPRQCGFCPDQFQTWEERINAVALHFEQGTDISSWKNPSDRPKDTRDDRRGLDHRRDDDDDDEDDPPDHGKGNGKKARLEDNNSSFSTQTSSCTAQNTEEEWADWAVNWSFDAKQQQLSDFEEEKWKQTVGSFEQLELRQETVCSANSGATTESENRQALATDGTPHHDSSKIMNSGDKPTSEPRSNVDSHHYQMYQPLDQPDSIRLLRLLPSTSFGSEIHCELFTCSLSKAPKYEALSYTWGGPVFSASLSTSYGTLKITQHLASALQGLRPKSGDARLLWIDAICIDQQSGFERDRQVCLMAEIYRKATEVIVWHGKEANQMNDDGIHRTLKIPIPLIGVDYGTTYMNMEPWRNSSTMRLAALRKVIELFRDSLEEYHRNQNESVTLISTLATKYLDKRHCPAFLSVLYAEKSLMELQGHGAQNSGVVLDYVKRWILLYWHMDHLERMQTRPAGCRFPKCSYSKLLTNLGEFLRQKGRSTSSLHNQIVGHVEVDDDEEIDQPLPLEKDFVVTEGDFDRDGLPPLPATDPARALHATFAPLPYSIQRFLCEQEDTYTALRYRQRWRP